MSESKKLKLVFAPIVFEDLNRLYSFIQSQNPRSLSKAAQRIEDAFLLLQKYPYGGYALEQLPRFRELVIPFGKGNYVIRYEIKEHEIRILHIWHSREDKND